MRKGEFPCGVPALFSRTDFERETAACAVTEHKSLLYLFSHNASEIWDALFSSDPTCHADMGRNRVQDDT